MKSSITRSCITTLPIGDARQACASFYKQLATINLPANVHQAQKTQSAFLYASLPADDAGLSGSYLSARSAATNLPCIYSPHVEH